MIKFQLGEHLECDFNRGIRRAEVINLTDEGWGAKMRFLDDGDTDDGEGFANYNEHLQ